METDLYSMPKYYEIAFNYRDVNKEVDFLEGIFRTHLDKEIHSVLDIACGTCFHSFELAKRGYEVGGLDISAEMLKYAKRKFDQNGLRVNLLRGDMKVFRTDKLYDSAICMGDSLTYLLEDEEYYSHLKSVSRILKRDGIYIVDLDNPNYWFGQDFSQELHNDWEMVDGSIRVRVRLHRFPIASKNKIHRVKISLDVRDGEKEYKNESYHDGRVLFPEDFRKIVNAENSFELLKYYGDFDLKQESDDSKKSWRMIAVLRKIN